MISLEYDNDLQCIVRQTSDKVEIFANYKKKSYNNLYDEILDKLLIGLL